VLISSFLSAFHLFGRRVHRSSPRTWPSPDQLGAPAFPQSEHSSGIATTTKPRGHPPHSHPHQQVGTCVATGILGSLSFSVSSTDTCASRQVATQPFNRPQRNGCQSVLDSDTCAKHTKGVRMCSCYCYVVTTRYLCRQLLTPESAAADTTCYRRHGRYITRPELKPVCPTFQPDSSSDRGGKPCGIRYSAHARNVLNAALRNSARRDARSLAGNFRP